MDEPSLDDKVLKAIQELTTSSKWPHPNDIYRKLRAEGLAVTPKAILAAIYRLEEAGKIARAPTYYVV